MQEDDEYVSNWSVGYVVISGADGFHLSKQVIRYADHGWQPQGGISVAPGHDGYHRFYQAMIHPKRIESYWAESGENFAKSG